MSASDSGSTVLAKQGGIALVGNLFTKLVEFGFIALATRLVVPGDFGVYTLALSLVVFTKSIADLSLYRSIDYFVPIYLNDEEFGKAKSVIIRALLLPLPVVVGTTLAIVLFDDVAAEVFSEPGLAVVLPVMSLLLVLRLFHDTAVSVFNSIKQLQYRVYVHNIVRPAGKLVATAVLVLAGYELLGLVLGHLLALAASAALGGILLVKKVPWFTENTRVAIPRRSLVTYSLPLAFSGVIYATVGQIDYFAIGYFASSADVAVYRVDYLLASNLLIFLQSLKPIFKPMIAESVGEPAALQSKYRLATRWVTMLTLPAAVTLAVAPRTYLELFFTAEYTATTVLMVLVIGQLLNIAVGPSGPMLNGIGRTRLTMANTLILLFTNLSLDVLLVPRLGILGAAIATATALIVTGIVALAEISFLTEVGRVRLGTLRIWIGIIPAVVVGVGVTQLLKIEMIVAFVLPVLVVGIYLLTLRLIGAFEPEDSEIAIRLDTRLGYRVFQRLVV